MADGPTTDGPHLTSDPNLQDGYRLLREGRIKESFVALVQGLGTDPRTAERRMLFDRAFTKEQRLDHIGLMIASALLEDGDVVGAATIYQVVRQSAAAGQEFSIGIPNEDAWAYCDSVGHPIAYVPGYDIGPLPVPEFKAVNKSYVFGLPRGMVAGESFLPASADGHVFINQVAYNRTRTLRYDAGDTQDAIAVPAHSRYLFRTSSFVSHGPAVLIGSSGNIGHWLMNNFARLALVEAHDDLKNLPVIIGHDTPPIALEMLERLGIGPDRRIALRPGQMTQFEMLWVPTQLFCQVGEKYVASWSPNLLHFIRRSLGVGDPKPGKRKLFITRRAARFRRLTNEDDIFQALQPLGFESIEAGGMSLSAQIDLAADAEIIVGPYGAGMNLGLFAPRNIPIVEIGYPELRLRILPAICAALSQKYVSADRPSFPEGRNSLRLDFSVPPEKILARVTAALGRT